MGDGPGVRCLLDTHVWIWSQESPDRLTQEAKEALVHPETRVWVSPVSTLEIARLRERGAITFKVALDWWIRQSAKALRAETIEVSHAIAMEAYSLPEPFHRDPADRILVATARCHDLRLVTADGRILAYPHVETIRAG